MFAGLCPQDMNIEGGTVETNVTTLTVTCGDYFTGSGSRTCEDGEWIPREPPTCVPSKCQLNAT